MDCGERFTTFELTSLQSVEQIKADRRLDKIRSMVRALSYMLDEKDA